MSGERKSKPKSRSRGRSRGRSTAGKVYPVGHERRRRRSHSKGKNISDSCKTRENMREASELMSLTQLQSMAKKKGIAFGGLTKKQLVQKICQYS